MIRPLCPRRGHEQQALLGLPQAGRPTLNNRGLDLALDLRPRPGGRGRDKAGQARPGGSGPSPPAGPGGCSGPRRGGPASAPRPLIGHQGAATQGTARAAHPRRAARSPAQGGGGVSTGPCAPPQAAAGPRPGGGPPTPAAIKARVNNNSNFVDSGGRRFGPRITQNLQFCSRHGRRREKTQDLPLSSLAPPGGGPYRSAPPRAGAEETGPGPSPARPRHGARPRQRDHTAPPAGWLLPGGGAVALLDNRTLFRQGKEGLGCFRTLKSLAPQGVRLPMR